MTGEGADGLFAGYPYFTADVPGGRRAGIAQQLANWSQLLGSRQFVSGFLAVPRERMSTVSSRCLAAYPISGFVRCSMAASFARI
jgi:asparagine synthetase B (glutamine-hydrolysing)